MKKSIIILITMIIICLSFSYTFASVEDGSGEKLTSISTTEAKDTTEKNDSSDIEELDDRMGNASKTTIENVNSKEAKIEQYTKELGGNRTNGTVLYYLKEVQKYSIPVCFVGLVIASLNFFIIGNKKLEKRESGFRMLVTLIVGLIVFQVLPLLFAIIVAGR